MAAMLLLAAMLAASVPAAEQATIFKTAGFAKRGSTWESGNCDGSESESYSPGSIDSYRDLNGDGRPEALVIEGGAICYGTTGMHFWLLSKQVNGGWKLVAEETAMPDFLATKGAGGWPDIQLGGPGFCFRIARWNGSAYVTSRFEYAGKRCKP